MPVCGGLRKMRVADPRRGKGKRGGIRVIYLHIDEVDQIHLVTVHGKDQKDDLSADDNNSYRALVRILNDQSRRINSDSSTRKRAIRCRIMDSAERTPSAYRQFRFTKRSCERGKTCKRSGRLGRTDGSCRMFQWIGPRAAG
jgi:hypothetical protein